jgi:alpha-tubulin suppressor-like RCC1 family protein
MNEAQTTRTGSGKGPGDGKEEDGKGGDGHAERVAVKGMDNKGRGENAGLPHATEKGATGGAGATATAGEQAATAGAEAGAEHTCGDTAGVSAAAEEKEAAPLPPFLRTALHPNWAYHMIKYLHPRDSGRLEACHTTVTPVLRVVAGRMNDASRVPGGKEGAMFVKIGAGRDAGWISWSWEGWMIYIAVARLQVRGAKNRISAGRSHSLITSGKASTCKTWSFGSGSKGKLGHGGVQIQGYLVGGYYNLAGIGAAEEELPRLIEALRGVVVKQVVAGSSTSMVRTSDGDIWTWGGGDSWQLGHGNTDNLDVPKRVEGLTNVTDIASGANHSLAVVDGGGVYTWGTNVSGQLGLGEEEEERAVPTLVGGLRGVVAVAGGECHSLALRSDGTVMACGENNSGRLGLGDRMQRDTFTVVPGLRGVVDIDAGGEHSIAVTCEGEVWTWGKGLAIGHGGDYRTERLVPTKVTGGGIDEAAVVQVAAGRHHSMALTATGVLYSWGKGDHGQLGHGGIEHLAVPRVVDGIGDVVVDMACGVRHSLVTTGEGRVMAFFVQMDGALGHTVLEAGELEALTLQAVDEGTLGDGEDGKEGKEGKE